MGRYVAVSKIALSNACQRILNEHQIRCNRLDELIAEAKEEYCKKTMQKRQFIFFGKLNTRRQAEHGWEMLWDYMEDLNSGKGIDVLVSDLTGIAKDVRLLKREAEILKTNKTVGPAWTLQKLAAATHGPVVKIAEDDFNIVALYIDG